MGRLKSVRPRLRPAVPSHVKPIQTGQDRSRARDEAQAWRRWYKTKRWQSLRVHVLRRDKYECQQTGVLLIGKYPAPNSPVVDHRRPHRGDAKLFWDPENLQAVSKAYHDSTKQSLEKRGLA